MQIGSKAARSGTSDHTGGQILGGSFSCNITMLALKEKCLKEYCGMGVEYFHTFEAMGQNLL